MIPIVTDILTEPVNPQPYSVTDLGMPEEYYH